MGQQNIFEHAIIGGLLTKLNQMCEKNLTLPVTTSSDNMSETDFRDIGSSIRNMLFLITHRRYNNHTNVFPNLNAGTYPCRAGINW